MDHLLTSISILYRYIQKYLDKYLLPYNLGSGQFIFMLLINENEGITMQKLAEVGDFDKGTTSKSIQKLEELNYVIVKPDEQDRRSKRLYLTASGIEVMRELYQIRNACCNQLLYGLEDCQLVSQVEKMTNNSRVFLEKQSSHVKIGGIQKLSLLDYPDQMACTIFTSGCNFKCPFCHNKNLVFVPADVTYYEQAELMDYLKKRKGILKAVCISGGEPCLHQDLLELIKDIKELGYLIKLDTNGYYPEKLEAMLETGLIDYVAMDIKNSADKYAKTTGLDDNSFDITKIDQSIKIIKEQAKDYEFRTTIVDEFHTLADIKAITERWLKGVMQYSLQYYVESEGVIMKGLHPCSEAMMHQMKEELEKTIANVKIKGGDANV